MQKSLPWKAWIKSEVVQSDDREGEWKSRIGRLPNIQNLQSAQGTELRTLHLGLVAILHKSLAEDYSKNISTLLTQPAFCAHSHTLD